MTDRALYRIELVALLALMLASATASAGITFARASQSSSTQSQSGIELYEKADFPQAVKVLKTALKQDKNNVALWHYLGLAYEGTGEFDDARKAHEKAAKAGESLITVELSKSIGPNYLEQLRKMAPDIGFASSSAIRHMQLTPESSKAKHVEAYDRAGYLSYVEKLSRDTDASFGEFALNSDGIKKARILSKPEPQYTDAARKNQITGTVILRAIFGADGNVHAVIPIRLLPDGLTDRAYAAVRQIRFEPAIKDGHPVAVAVQIEYNFNLY